MPPVAIHYTTSFPFLQPFQQLFSKISQKLLTNQLNIDIILLVDGELAQLARASALHAGGQGFESLILHHRLKGRGCTLKTE